MNKKMIAVFLAAFFIAGTAAIPLSFANHGHRGGACPMKSGGGMWHQMGLKEKFFMKAHFFLENEKELGLTADQVASIKKLKVDAKKAKIRAYADVATIKVDIMSRLMDDPLDVEGINALIDQKYEAKKALAKSFVAYYGQLKAVLTPEQKEKAKEIWMKK